jgi:hypothetical protein
MVKALPRRTRCIILHVGLCPPPALTVNIPLQRITHDYLYSSSSPGDTHRQTILS